jgi:TPR repeat protein
MYLQFSLSNFREAGQYYQMAVAQGNADALNNLGGLIESGKLAGGVQAAFQNYEQAAAKGHAGAKYNLGRFHERGLVGKRNLAKATALYREASLAGNTDAGAGFARVSGTSAPGDLAKAADSGDVRAQVKYGVLLCDEENFAGAADYFKKAADAKDPAGLFNLAWLAKKRSLKGLNPVDLYRKAGERGLGRAWVNLAILSFESEGDEEAWEWLCKEAATGDAYAWNNMAVAIGKGFVKRDLEFLRLYYKRAADRGLPAAMLSFAALLETTVGGQALPEQAARYYRKAVEASNGELKAAERALKRLNR